MEPYLQKTEFCKKKRQNLKFTNVLKEHKERVTYVKKDLIKNISTL